MKALIIKWTSIKLDKLTHKQLRELIVQKRMHNAKLVWITPDAEALVGKIARVSNPNNEDNPKVEKTHQVSHQAQTLESL